MAGNYFRKLKEKTKTRLWVNNPTVPEVEESISHGALGCTTNPTYGANMIKRDTDYAIQVMETAMAEKTDDNEAADPFGYVQWIENAVNDLEHYESDAAIERCHSEDAAVTEFFD